MDPPPARHCARAAGRVPRFVPGFAEETPRFGRAPHRGRKRPVYSSDRAMPPTEPPTHELLLAGWRVQPGLNRLTSPGGALHQLEPKAMDVLVALTAARGEVVTREQLIERVWGGGF